MYANSHNQRSLQLPHDRVGHDHGSVGLFQQQVGGAPDSTANWGTTDELMNVATELQGKRRTGDSDRRPALGHQPGHTVVNSSRARRGIDVREA
jgi:hypothetical protein